jgi:hypothetical protein
MAAAAATAVRTAAVAAALGMVNNVHSREYLVELRGLVLEAQSVSFGPVQLVHFRPLAQVIYELVY